MWMYRCVSNCGFGTSLLLPVISEISIRYDYFLACYGLGRVHIYEMHALIG